MKARTLFAILIVVTMLITSVGFAADDGPLFHRNVSGTPHQMTGASQMSAFWLYVPAQTPSGDSLDTTDGLIEYYAGDCTTSDPSGCELAYTRPEAKPLIATYNDGVGEEELGTGAGFGVRDAFAALSLDDGHSWKRYNLSDSALRSSFRLTTTGEDYPGDVFKLVHAVEGNMVAAAWISRYCESGAPLYSWLPEEKAGLLAAYPDLANPVIVDGGTSSWTDTDEYQLYMDDLFGVAGTQVSVNYTLQGFPDVGEIPYGCVWVARGTLEQALDEGGAPLFNDLGDPVYDITWRASERLTSGRRDPHQINITSSPGAGFIVEWQEDPDGLRPGKGLGPGEGWSGAIANSKTDLWYTYIDLDYFADVCTDDVDDVYCTPGTLADFNATDLFGTKPKAAVPFAMPVRITDNNVCKGEQKFDTNSELLDPYCYADFNNNGTADLCAEVKEWTNPGGTILQVCQTEDGRVLTGRTASTRVRWAMKPYTAADGSTSAWVVFGAEKMKALGTVGDGDCDPRDDSDPDCTVYDIGKNMWYYTFEFDKPALVTQGLILNSPALSPETGEEFEIYTDEFENEVRDTEIARRFNLMVNSPAAAMASDSQTMGVVIYKQGILFQGGPADIFTRRIVLPEDFDPQVDNPFAYENVECVSYDDTGVATDAEVLYADGSNPNYLLGMCSVDGMNVSGTDIVRCTDGSTGETCAEAFPFSSTYEEWFSEDSSIQIPKVLEWSQTEANFNDPSWANPYDVSKGHRGFMDGDFVMMMYATGPNWKANTVGNEAYNLYIRRSFDGGQSWTTLPASFAHIDGVTYNGVGTEWCEDYGGYTEDDYSFCTNIGAGEFEPARNVSRLTGTRVTVLDPRYSPTGGMLKRDYSSLVCDDDLDGIWEACGDTDAEYPEDIRDPSKFFVTYETGDNTVVTEETGTIPMDMYYSVASNFGDVWDAQDVCNLTDLPDDEEPWYPNTNVSCEEGETDMRWDWLENGPDLATEASVYGNPAGDRFYAVWNQELPLGDDHYTDMDSEFRRIFYNTLDGGVPVPPTASILYATTMVDYDDEYVTLVGTGRDLDDANNLGADDDGIQEAKWWVTISGTTHTYEGRTMQAPPNGFIPGKHDFNFKVTDNEGQESRVQTVTVWIAEKFYNIYLPTVTR